MYKINTNKTNQSTTNYNINNVLDTSSKPLNEDITNMRLLSPQCT